MKCIAMKNAVKCSIVIVHYSNDDVLARCLASIERNGLVGSEVIIIDNSTKQYLNKKYRVINNEQNVGFAKACNQGVLLARGRYILILNPDTELTDDFISKGIITLEINKNIGIVSPALISPSGEKQESAYYYPSLKNLVYESFFIDRVLGVRNDFGSIPLRVLDGSKQIYADWVCGAAMLMRKDDFINVGGFDHEYFMYFEDVDLCSKINKTGKKTLCLCDKKIIHDDKTANDAFNPKFNSSKKILIINKSIKKYWLKNKQIGLNIELILTLRAFIRVILWSLRYLLQRDEGYKQRIVGYCNVIKFNIWK